MKKKLLIIIPVLCILILIVFALLDELPLLTSSVPVETHTDSERGFSFDYPKTWEYIEDWDLEYRNEKFVTGVMRQNLPGVACGVIVDERPASLKYEPKKTIADLDEVLDYTRQDFRKLKAHSFNLGDLPAIEYFYNYTREGTSIYVRLRQFIIYAPDKIYTIACGCPDSRYKEFSRDFDVILQSFHLTQEP